MSEEIRSESKFILDLIKSIILLPITLVLILFKKRKLSDLLNPFKALFTFLLEPKFTMCMICINIILFFTSFLFPETLMYNLISHPNDLIEFKWHTLITSGFLHANVMHLLGNMLCLFALGRVVEQKIGSLKMGILYFGALVISGLFTSFIHLFIIGDNVGGLGASGALMGIVSAAILLAPLYITYVYIVPLPVMIIGWLSIYGDIVGVLNPVEDGIGHFAHIGGFISISLLLFLFNIEEKAKLKKGFVINICILTLALLAGFLGLKEKLGI